MKKTIIILCSLILLSLTACGEDNLYNNSSKSGYKKVTSVNGMSFDVPSKLSSMATAITEINEKSKLSYNETYSYKDGQSNYLLFLMETFVIIASNDVEYNITSTNTADIVNGLNDYYMLGLRIDTTEDSISCDSSTKNGVMKVIAKVDAELILTREFYGEFSGKIAYINDGTNEFALFIGVVADGYDNINEEGKEMINYVTKSLQPCNTPTDQSILITNTITPEQNESTEKEENVETPDNIEPDIIEPEKPEQPTEPDIEIKPEEIPEILPDVPEEPIEPEKPEEFPEIEPEPEVPATTEPEENEEKPNDTSEKEPEDSTTVIIPDDMIPQGITLNNQYVNTSSDNIKASSIYSMLSLNESGYMSIINSLSQKVETISITATNIHTGKAAEEIIKEYCLSNDSPYPYAEPSPGTTWHVIEYSVDYANATLEGDYLPYVNIKLLGFDGNSLVFRGVCYSKKTHDIHNKCIHKGNVYEKYYAFYEVPNGCKEYLIEAGSGSINTINKGILSAYYHINIK